MQIGRKIYYKLSDGTALCDTGECQGDVRETTEAEDIAAYPTLSGYTADQLGVIQLDYGARDSEFANMGSMHIDITQTPPALIIYPHMTMAADKTTITPGGIDKVTITVTVADIANAHPIVFTTSAGGTQTINTENGTAVLTVTSTSTERVTITATSDLYGSGSIVITPTTDTEQKLQQLATTVALMDAALAKKEGSN